MRLHHEKRLREEIDEAMARFAASVRAAAALFVHAPGKINADLVLKSPALPIDGTELQRRVRRFPRSPAKATFAEIKTAERAMRFVKLYQGADCGCGARSRIF